MAITIGLDFGTHQTKVCIENSNDSQRKTYEFFIWENGTPFLPSVIQINENHTLSYGIADTSLCLYAPKLKRLDKPQEPIYPPQPILPNPIESPIYPNEPVKMVKKNGEEVLVPLSKLVEINQIQDEEYKKWKSECDRLKEDYRERLDLWRKLKSQGLFLKSRKPQKPILPPKPQISERDKTMEASNSDIAKYLKWKSECKRIENTYILKQQSYNKRFIDYNKAYVAWQKECSKLDKRYKDECQEYEVSLREMPMIFRYFKQATFSQYNWKYEIKSEMLCIWYLAYVIFILEERFGKDFAIQMGVPASKETFPILKRSASTILIQAYRLVEDVYENDMKRFLSATVEDLIKCTPSPEYTSDLKELYGIMIIPEAYASLRSVTTNGRIPNGMNLMFDIGGGTTDISFFVIEKTKEPHVYHYTSIPKGLNYFLEYDVKSKYNDVSVKRELEDLNEKIFNEAKRNYFADISIEIKKLLQWLHLDTIIRGFEKNAFTNAVKNRPLIYSGGGCSEKKMRASISPFDDVKYLSGSMLKVPNLIGDKVDNNLMHILATSYGLSIAMNNDDIPLSKKEELFDKLDNRKNSWDEPFDYGLMDE